MRCCVSGDWRVHAHSHSAALCSSSRGQALMKSSTCPKVRPASIWQSTAVRQSRKDTAVLLALDIAPPAPCRQSQGTVAGTTPPTWPPTGPPRARSYSELNLGPPAQSASASQRPSRTLHHRGAGLKTTDPALSGVFLGLD